MHQKWRVRQVGPMSPIGVAMVVFGCENLGFAIIRFGYFSELKVPIGIGSGEEAQHEGLVL